MTALRLALVGASGSGKDTLARAVLDQLPPGTGMRELRVGALVIADLDRTAADAEAVIAGNRNLGAEDRARLGDLASRVRRVGGRSVRDLPAGERRAACQWWGRVRRAQDPDHWTSQLLSELRAVPDDEGVLVADARTPGEARALRSAGVTVVELLVSGEERRRRLVLRDGEASAELLAGDEYQTLEAAGVTADLQVQLAGDPLAVAREVLSLTRTGLVGEDVEL